MFVFGYLKQGQTMKTLRSKKSSYATTLWVLDVHIY